MDQLISLFTTAVTFGTVIMYGAMGEILTEKSGNLNLGVPGIMYIGGIAGLIGSFFYENGNPNAIPFVGMLIALVCAFAAAALAGLLYSFLTITLRANQNVTGLTLTIFGAGFANYFGGSLNTMAGGVGQISVALTSGVFRYSVPALKTIPVAGQLFFSYGYMVYLAIILAIVLNWVISRTSVGLNLRAVGENAATADAAGINVTRYKYLATCIGAGISGLGGLYYVMDYIKGTWANDGNIEALGWLAVALVIFATWKSVRAIWGAYLFGALYWLYNFVPSFIELLNNTFGWSIPPMTRAMQQIIQMLPYVVTIIVLLFVSFRKRKEDQPPASLGIPYFREER